VQRPRARALASSSWRSAAAVKASPPTLAWCPPLAAPGRACAGAASIACFASTCGSSRVPRAPSSSMRKGRRWAWRSSGRAGARSSSPWPPSIGLQPLRLDEALAQAHALPSRRGIMVVSLDPNGPARAAGVYVGDVIISFDGEAVSGVRSLHARLTPESVGRNAELKMVRAGQIASAKITIGPSPTP